MSPSLVCDGVSTTGFRSIDNSRTTATIVVTGDTVTSHNGGYCYERLRVVDRPSLKTDVKDIIESIEVETYHLADIGAKVGRVYDEKYDAHVMTVLYWLPKTVRSNKLLKRSIPAIHGFSSGAPPRNRGRHFNRKVHWLRNN